MRQTNWLICAMAMGVLSAPAQARDWYFSNSGTTSSATVNTSTTPWASPSMLNGVHLAAGDTINLRCADIWQEHIRLTSDLTAANAILATGAVTIRSWPLDCAAVSKNKPNLLGSDSRSLVTWVSGGSAGVYKTSWAPSLDAPPQLFINGVQFVRARYPNANANPNNYAVLQATAPPNTSVTSTPMATVTLNITDRANLAAHAMDISGATAYLRSELWVVEARKAAAGYSATAGVLPLDTPTLFSLSAGDGLVMENKRWMIDSPQEWFYDPAGWIYVQPPAHGSLGTASVELTTRSNIVTVSGVPNFTIKNVNLQHARENALAIFDSPNATVDGVSVSYAGVGGSGCYTTGVYIGPKRHPISASNGCLPSTAAANSAGATVKNSLFKGNGESAVYVESANALIQNNRINDTGTLAYSANALAAVRVRGLNARVKDNSISGSAYNAIEFGGSGESIQKNTITRFCVRYADCGAIYTFNGTPSQTAPVVIDQPGATITDNYIVVGTGDAQGSSDDGQNLVVGVYLDAFTNGVIVSGNAIDEVGVGIYLNGAYKNTLQDNWVHGARRAGLLASDGIGSGGYLRENIVSGNYFHAYNRFDMVAGSPLPLHNAGVAQEWYHSTDPQKLFVDDSALPSPRKPGRNTLSNNRAVDVSGKSNQWRVSSSNASYYAHDVSLGNWKNTFHATTDSVLRPAYGRLVHTASTQAGLSNDAEVLPGWFMQGGAGNGSATSLSATGCQGACQWINFLSIGAPYYNGDLTLSGARYYMEYLAVGADGSAANVNVQYAGWSQSAFAGKDGQRSYELGVGAPGQHESRWTEAFFNPSVVPTTAGITVYGALGSAGLDEVRLVNMNSLEQANLFAPSAYTRMIYNPAATAQTINCPFPTSCTGWVDEAGISIIGTSVSVPAGGKKMVFLPIEAKWQRPPLN